MAPKRKELAAAKIKPPVQIPCDRCGHSKIDGMKISDSKFEIITEAGSIFLCNHHYWIHRWHIISHNYGVNEHARQDTATKR